MNRRSFIAGVGAALAGAVLDPERALWVPKRYVCGIDAAIPFADFPFVMVTRTMSREEFGKCYPMRPFAQTYQEYREFCRQYPLRLWGPVEIES